MLEYDYQLKGEPEDHHDAPIPIGGNLMNPFPGLRPFEIEECHLFFGREKHVDEILYKLSEERFITILGYSGSGKSSLMYCGVIPVLLGGFMTNVGANWKVINARPGNSPIANLAGSILKGTRNIKDEYSAEFQLKQTIVSAVLKSGSDGLVRAIKQFRGNGNENYLVLIDQFEELFRFRSESGSEDAVEESMAFVQLLLNAIQESEVPIYVALTMRSDFMGECSAFHGLTARINKSNYLVPRMKRDQKRIAIEGPVAVGGGAISPRLVKRLLDEVGDNQDQLPLLQHALMRTWDYWKENRDEKEAIDIRHYNAVGQIGGALSQHADEIFGDLDARQKEIAEVMFKALTRKGQDGSGIRIPVRLGNIAQLAGASNEEVMEVIEEFRKPGRSFLMPSANLALDQDSVIEISHESLMRIWVRLKNWVDEEHESAQMYLRLSEAAEMYQIGRTGLWRPPDLQLALNWQKKQKPNRLWAKRYNEAFERAIVFLDTSRITYEAEQKNQEMLQKRLLRRARVVAVILGIAAIIAIAFFIYGVIQQRAAENNMQLAIANEQIAIEAAETAEREAIAAQLARDEADSARRDAELANIQLARTINQLNQRNQQLAEAIASEQAALRDAIVQREQAEEQRGIAVSERRKSDSLYLVAQKNFEDKQNLLYLAVAQAMSAKSLTVEDNDLHGLLALQAYVFFNEHGGRKYDPYIYNGLYTTLTQMDGIVYNTQFSHRGNVRSVDFPTDSRVYYTTGEDGRVIQHNFDDPEGRKTLSTSSYRNKIVSVNHSGELIASGGDSSFVNLFQLNQPDNEPKVIPIHQSYINDIIWHPDNRRIITVGGDRTIRITDVNTGQSRIIRNSSSEYRVIDVSKSGKFLLAGAEDGRVSLFDLGNFSERVIRQGTGTPVYSVAIAKTEDTFAVGDEKGSVSLWDVESGTLIRSLRSHKSRVTDIEYSDDGELLATSSLDKTIFMWVLDELDELPIVINDNDSYVWDMDFTPDSQYLVAGVQNGSVRVWVTDPQLMARGMCERLTRNMTMEEWNTYVKNDIPYMNTCVDKILNQ